MINMNPEVDAYFGKAKKWKAELEALRKIVLACGLTEELKWRLPCYTFGATNIVILQSFKDYCALSFFKGALLRDPEGILSKPGENTQSGRLVRFTTVSGINKMKAVLKSYILEAIEAEKAGRKVELKKHEEYAMPEELKAALDDDRELKKAFGSLTPGRQRAYILYFSAAKQSETRISRIEKCSERILSGKGLTDCICGLTKKPPYCDGSHKFIGKGKAGVIK